jgi:glycyl-tRNA synthetase
VEEFTPNVIEPSFGLGRILYALLEHSYWARESDINRGVLSLPPLVAPVKVLIVPISSQDTFDPLIKEICTSYYLRTSMHTVDLSPQLPSCARLVSFPK